MTIERDDISTEAVKVNGVYLEDIVPGYRTIKSVGRELIGRELSVSETSVDGTLFRDSWYEPREIKVQFIIQRNTLANMRLSMDDLKAALDVKEAHIIFNGDVGYYYIGTPIFDDSITEVKTGLIGSFIIHCSDPFKYSVAEYTATARNGMFSVDYGGTYRSYPTFVVEFADEEDTDGDSTSTSECGFVGFVDQREHVLQFGDPDETDWADVAYPATVPVNKTFKGISGWGANNSSVITGTQAGSVAVAGSDHIYPSGYGSGSGYHGPSLSKVITGETAPIGENFNFSWKQNVAGSKSEFGGCEIILWNNNNGARSLVCAVRILKTTKDKKCKVYLYVGLTASKKNYSVACSKIGSCSMKKIGSRITFNVGGKQYEYGDPNIDHLIASEITFHFLRNGSKTSLGKNYIYKCKLQRFSFDNYEDVQNIFAPGDVLTISTKDAGVYLDDGSATVPATYLGALGNDWEDFCLVPGSNTIGVDYSDFTNDEPVFTIKYRERFI